MIQFAGSLATFSRRSDVTSAAIAVVAKAATLIDANAVTSVLSGIGFLPYCQWNEFQVEQNSSEADIKPRCPLWKGVRGQFCSFDTLRHPPALTRGKAKA